MIRIILSEPTNKSKTFDFTIRPYDTLLGRDWQEALKVCIIKKQKLHKEWQFLGFPNTYRDYDFLLNNLNRAINKINNNSIDYYIEEEYSLDTIITKDNHINHETMNRLHNHFEILKGTEWEPSEYWNNSKAAIRKSIEDLNFSCHELELYSFAKRQWHTDSLNCRPWNDIKFYSAKHYNLKDEHRELFKVNRYDEMFGGVYMHWCQIGKRLDEVFSDEGPVDLVYTNPTDIRTKQEDGGARCEAITALRYYSGEFSICWGKNMTRTNNTDYNDWHTDFFKWIEKNGMDPEDPKLSLGLLPLGQVEIEKSFGTINPQEVWNILSNHMWVRGIEIEDKQILY